MGQSAACILPTQLAERQGMLIEWGSPNDTTHKAPAEPPAALQEWTVSGAWPLSLPLCVCVIS